MGTHSFIDRPNSFTSHEQPSIFSINFAVLCTDSKSNTPFPTAQKSLNKTDMYLFLGVYSEQSIPGLTQEWFR